MGKDLKKNVNRCIQNKENLPIRKNKKFWSPEIYLKWRELEGATEDSKWLFRMERSSIHHLQQNPPEKKGKALHTIRTQPHLRDVPEYLGKGFSVIQ